MTAPISDMTNHAPGRFPDRRIRSWADPGFLSLIRSIQMVASASPPRGSGQYVEERECLRKTDTGVGEAHSAPLGGGCAAKHEMSGESRAGTTTGSPM